MRARRMNVVVVGGTGHLGGAVARALLSRGYGVTILTRDPTGHAARLMHSFGARVALGDLADRASLERVLLGADTVFAMTTAIDRGAAAEALGGANLVTAARRSGIGHLVLSTAATCGLTLERPTLDAKSRIELNLARSGLVATVVAPAFFMENLLRPAFLSGLRAGRLTLPAPPNRPIDLMTWPAYGNIVAQIIEQPRRWVDRRVELICDRATGPELALGITRATGGSVVYEQGIAPTVGGPRAADGPTWVDRIGREVDLESLRVGFPSVAFPRFGEWASRQDWRVERERVALRVD